MIDYKQLGFGSVLNKFDPSTMVATRDDYTLCQIPRPNGKKFDYKVYDPYDVLVGQWVSKHDCLKMNDHDLEHCNDMKIFFKVVDNDIKANQLDKEPDYDDYFDKDYYDYYDDDYYGVDWLDRYLARTSGKSGKRKQKNRGYYYNYEPYVYKPKPKSTGFLDKLNKSNTLVIHCEDRTTEMLCQIYEGKGWDVLRDGDIDKEELHKLLESHDRIIMLGHGTTAGLINKQGFGYTIGDDEAPYLKDKKLFVIWCYASVYGKRHGLHGFWTENMPSDSWEAKAVGFNVGEQYMLDNITYWSKCCADVVEMALEGNAQAAAAKVREEYLKVYGDESKWNDQELGITHYNAERTLAI